MTGKKILLIIVALTLLLASLLLLLRRRNNQAEVTIIASAPDGSFRVQIERPILSGRPIWDVPRAIIGERDPELRFGDASPGARVVGVGPNHLELSADGGWDLVIESEGQRRVSTGTRLVFTLTLPDRSLRLNCRPTEDDVNHFNSTARAESDKFDGDFYLRLTECKNAESGKNTAGLPTFIVRGSFKGLSQNQRP